MSIFTSNTPPLSQGNCSSNCCSCNNSTPSDELFNNQTLFALAKTDRLSTAYEKINANFKMLSDGYLILAHAIRQREEVTFGSNLPSSRQGNFFYYLGHQKLYIWNETQSCYIPAYGKNSTDDSSEKLGVDHTPDNSIASLEQLRNIFDGIDVSHFPNKSGVMKITFVNDAPMCDVGVFIYDKSDGNLKVWSPADNVYIPAFGCFSVTDKFLPMATTAGDVVEVVQLD